MYYPIKFLLHPSVFGVPPVISSPVLGGFEGGAPPRVERLADRSGAGGAWGFNKSSRWKDPPCSMGKPTISMGYSINSYVSHGPSLQ